MLRLITQLIYYITHQLMRNAFQNLNYTEKIMNILLKNIGNPIYSTLFPLFWGDWMNTDSNDVLFIELFSSLCKS